MSLKSWAQVQMPDPAVYLDRIPPRVWLAALVTVGWRQTFVVARHRLWAWTRLPGDEVEHLPRDCRGIVLRVPYPGRADVAWRTRRSNYTTGWLEQDVDLRGTI